MWFSSNSSTHKIEIVEFPDGKFGLRRNESFYDPVNHAWREAGTFWMKYCGIDTLVEAQTMAGVCKVVSN